MKWVQRFLFLACLLFIAALVPYRTDFGHFCEYTGSRRTHTVWLFIFETDHLYQKSKLEELIARKHPDDLQHRWVSFMGTSRTLFGLQMNSHGSPNELFYFQPSLFAEWCVASTDQEKKQFYDFLLTASRDEVKAKVRSMVELMIN